MPSWTKELEARLASLRLRPAREREIIDELSEHLELRYAELRDQGVDEAEALALVRAELQDDEALAEFMRPLRQANAPPPPGPVGAPRAGTLGRRASHARQRVLRFRRPRCAPCAARLTAPARLHARHRAHARARHRRDHGDFQRRLLGADQAAVVSECRRAREDPAHRHERRQLRRSGLFHFAVDVLHVPEREPDVRRDRPVVGARAHVDWSGDSDRVRALLVSHGTLQALGVQPMRGRGFTEPSTGPPRKGLRLSFSLTRSGNGDSAATKRR